MPILVILFNVKEIRSKYSRSNKYIYHYHQIYTMQNVKIYFQKQIFYFFQLRGYSVAALKLIPKSTTPHHVLLDKFVCLVNITLIHYLFVNNLNITTQYLYCSYTIITFKLYFTTYYNNCTTDSKQILATMKFLITSKDQTDGTKQKIPFYKYVDQDLQLKEQPPQYDVLEYPNIKVYCEDCEKQITIDTIIMAYGSLKSQQEVIQEEVIQEEVIQEGVVQEEVISDKEEDNAEDDVEIPILYCVACFAKLSSLDKNSYFPQKYIIRKNLKCSFTGSRWNLFDEVCLLNSLQIWGFGNWNQIKDFMDYNGSLFQAEEIQNHYEQIYLHGQANNLKILTQSNQPRALKKQTLQQIQRKYYLSLNSSASLQSQRNLNSVHQYQKGNNVYSYNPKRKQFQIIEYDYYAESMLAYLQFYEDQTIQEQELKIQIIVQYNKRLDQRKKRRDFVIQHRLLDNNFHFQNIKNLNLSIKKFQPFRRFTQSIQEYQEILKLYGQQVRIKKIIQGLKKLRGMAEKGKMKQIIGYIQKKKQKKILLGSSQKSNSRKVYQSQKDSNSISKKLVLVNNNQRIYGQSKIKTKIMSESMNSIQLQKQTQFNLAPSQINYLQRKINLQRIEEFHIGNYKVTQVRKKVKRFQKQEK